MGRRISRGSADARILGIAALVLALLAAVVGLRFRVTTDISEFLPTGDERRQAELSKAVVSSELSRTIVVTVTAADAAEAAMASVALEEAIEADEVLRSAMTFVEGGPPSGIDETLWSLYQPRRLAFLAGTPEAARERLEDAGLQAAASSLRRRLETPLSTVVTRVAPEDPFLILPSLFERLEHEAPADVAVVAGRFVAGSRHAVLLLGTRASAFDARAQGLVEERLTAAFARLRAAHPDWLFEHSSVGRFAIVAEQVIRADIQRTTVLSVVGLLVIATVLFRSLRLVVLAFLPIAAGTLLALAVTLLSFGQVHGLTLAFGGSLIGVCVDYVVHFYVHHTLHPDPGGPRATMRRIGPGLWLGAITTLVGFAVMSGSSFPGLRQVATFASLGVTGALLSTWWMLPAMVPIAPAPVRARTWLADRLLGAFERLRRHRTALWPVVVAVAALGILGVARVDWNEDMRRFAQLDPRLQAEDERVRARVAQFDQSRFVLAVGETEEAALQVSDRVADRLAEAGAAGELDAWQSIATLLPSAARQRAVAEAVRDDASLLPRLRAALVREGFVAEAFAPFERALAEPLPEPLRYRDLAESPAAPLVRRFRVDLGDEIGFVTFVRGVDDPAALQRRLATLEGAYFLDQTVLMANATAAYRDRALSLLLVGLGAVVLVLAVRYRRWRRVLAAFTPACLAAGLTVAVLAALGIPLDLVGLTALLMVLSIGVDYGVFLVETVDEPREALGATLVGLGVAWSTTVLGFGLLALSQHPAMHAIGIVAAVGVSASLILAPTAWALWRPDRGDA